jgi:nucleoside 2-deoxyribosyltransferase
LRHFARWFDRVGAAELPLPADPSVLWAVFKRDYDRRAGQVFVAMSFRESKTLSAVYKAIEEAIAQFNAAHPNALLNPVRVDKYQGDSFDIPARVFQDIEHSCLVIADLTDEKQNVYCEVGYAKARGIPFFLTFQKTARKARPAKKVHFDLSPYRYIEYEDSLELRDKLKANLDAWHDRPM